MNDILKTTIDMICEIKKASQIKVGRNFTDFFTDRIRQATTETTLLSAIDRLCKMQNASIGIIDKEKAAKFIKAANNEKSHIILNWLRDQYKIAGMICFIKDESEKNEVINSIELIETVKIEPGKAIQRRLFDIEIEIECSAPLVHGGDEKSGNATLFRRMDVLSDTGYKLSLPYYAGNAFRGQMRDLLADHFLKSLDIEVSRRAHDISLWFFHSLYAGGALSEAGKETKAIIKATGGVALKAEGIHELRETIPHLSLLGFAFGNRILSGRINVGDFRPVCYQWGYDSDIQVGDLVEWIFLTRREDNEEHEDGNNSSMIANAECLKAGTNLHGGIDFRDFLVSDLEKSALIKGIELIQEYGRIGAENRRDCGSINLLFYSKGLSSDLYEQYLHDNKGKIIDYLIRMDCLSESKKANLSIDSGF